MEPQVTGGGKLAYVVRLTALGAAMMMAFQVAGKAARDALFLSSYRPSQLPPMIVAGALSAILLGIINGRLLARIAPRRFVPWLLIVSGSLHALEYLTHRQAPGLTAIGVYIHVVALGAIITSGFWSVVNEQFDPYTAKQTFGKIAAAGTAGGVCGGFLAERIAAFAPPRTVLLLLTAAQLIAGALVWRMPARSVLIRREKVHAWQLLRKSSYLRTLSLLVLTGTFSAALFDYVLKADARHTLGPGEPLMRFFALFHTATAALAFLVQATATSPLLNRFGLGTAILTLPASAAVGGFLAAMGRAFPFVIMARGVEAVLRGSFFRAGYELSYAPMPAVEKRTIKSVNDVTVDRLGDALGGAYAQAAIHLGPPSGALMLMTGAVTSGIGAVLARRLQSGYRRMLEHSLRYHAPDDDDDPSELPFSRDPDRAAHLPDWLADSQPLDRSLLHSIILLLADPDLRQYARHAISTVAAANVGQLCDHLLDASIDAEVRRHLPFLLAASGEARATDGLVLALSDPDRRIRKESARALDRLQQVAEVPVDEEQVYFAIRTELHSFAQPDLGYVFTLLSLVLPREPVRVASESLQAGDAQMRGLALEYLETAVPADISELLLAAISQPAASGDLRVGESS
jgi:hypothetical protein